jgi:hypothetical protein
LYKPLLIKAKIAAGLTFFIRLQKVGTNPDNPRDAVMTPKNKQEGDNKNENQKEQSAEVR